MNIDKTTLNDDLTNPKSVESGNQRKSAIQTNKYSNYKPSGIEWIGEIPEHWEVRKLKYALDSLESGSRETGGGSIEEGIFSIGGEHIGWLGELLLENPKYISEDYYNNLKNGKILKDDVLLVKDGATIGKCSIVKSLPFEKCAVNEHVFILRVNQNFHSKYLFYFICSRIGQEQILLDVRGSAQPGLNSQFINHVFISFPPKSEQTAIANYLDDKTAKIDSLIEKKKKLIELYKEERTAIINQAVTGSLSPLIKGGDTEGVRKKPSGIDWLGDIPEHWQVKKLKYVAEINSESLTEKEDEDLLIHYIDISSVDSNGNIISTTEYLYSDAPSRARRIVNKGDTILSTVRTYLKAIAFIEEVNNNLICSTGFAVIRPSDVFIPKFLFYIFRSQIIIEKIMASSKGVSYPAIDSEDIKFIPIWYPDKDEQRQIVQLIEAETKRIDDKISKTEKEISLLQEYRTALIIEVVTGKIKV